MRSSYGFYRFGYMLTRVLIGLPFRFSVSGRENIPGGAAIVSINHSSYIDPFFIAFAFGIRQQVHFVAKAELFRKPVISAAVIMLGAISVDRDISDITTIKNMLHYLKNNKKVAIFPEGTRARVDGAIEAKIGAVKIAEHSGVPILPIYVPRRKRLFRKTHIVIGKPYIIEKQKKKRTADEYQQLTDEMMAGIASLNQKAAANL